MLPRTSSRTDPISASRDPLARPASVSFNSESLYRFPYMDGALIHGMVPPQYLASSFGGVPPDAQAVILPRRTVRHLEAITQPRHFLAYHGRLPRTLIELLIQLRRLPRHLILEGFGVRLLLRRTVVAAGSM